MLTAEIQKGRLSLYYMTFINFSTDEPTELLLVSDTLSNLNLRLQLQ